MRLKTILQYGLKEKQDFLKGAGSAMRATGEREMCVVCVCVCVDLNLLNMQMVGESSSVA